MIIRHSTVNVSSVKSSFPCLSSSSGNHNAVLDSSNSLRGSVDNQNIVQSLQSLANCNQDAANTEAKLCTCEAATDNNLTECGR